MTIRHRLHLFGYSWRAVGPWVMLSNALRWSTDPEARAVDSGFDARHGTDTCSELTPGEAGIPGARRGSATMYLPTMDHDLEAMFAALDWPAELLAQTSFVDLGSGKGRVVLLAAMRRLREVVGVELSPVLHQVAQHNLEILRDAGALAAPVRLLLEDAAAYPVPDGPVITYLYHPFRADIAAAALDRLAASLRETPRPAAILYCHPILQPPLDPAVFERGDLFAIDAEGARRTRRFQIRWTIWTNRAWLGAAGC